MTNAPVQLRTTYDRQPTNPLIANHLWTFDNAIGLLKGCDDEFILEGLDTFLKLNRAVLLKPLPFSGKNDPSVVKVKDITLRDVTYSLTELNKEDCMKVQEVLENVDSKEILRIISQQSRRIPEEPLVDYVKSSLPDDRREIWQNKRLSLYISQILRERRTVIELIMLLLHNKTNESASDVVQNLGKEIYLSSPFILEVISRLAELINSLNQTLSADIPQEIVSIIRNETVLTVIDLLKLTAELLIGRDLQFNVIQNWFLLMEQTNFGVIEQSEHEDSSLSPESTSIIESLCSIVSVLLLDLDHEFGDVDNEDSYMNDPRTFEIINDSLANTASNAIVMYAWSLILYRKSVMIEEYPTHESSSTILTLFENNTLVLTKNLNAFITRASELQVYDCLKKCHEILKFDSFYTAILASLITNAIPVVSLTPEITSTIELILKDAPDQMISNFFNNEATQNLIILSRTKFPSLILPFINICNINGKFAINEIRSLRSYSVVYNRQEFEELYEIDDVDPDLVKLTQSIDIYPPFEKSKKLSLYLEKGTRAKIIPTEDENEILVAFLYNYNGWSLLGRMLQNISKNYDTQNVDDEKKEFIIDIFNLLTKITQDCSQQQAQEVLSEMSQYTDDSDIIEVLLRLFDQSLHSRDVEILEGGLNLLTELISVISYRIWPYLSKSALLTQMAVILGSIEMVNGDYKFSIALISFVQSLVRDCLTLEEDLPLKTKGEILGKFVFHLIQIFESFVHWRFVHTHQKLKIGVMIVDVFSNILTTVYGIDEQNEIGEKPTRVFATAANYITESFLMASSNNEDSNFTEVEMVRSTKPILSLIDSISDTLLVFETHDLSGFWYDNWIRSALSFAQLIISVRSVLDYAPSIFEQSLFKRLPNLVDIYSQNTSLRKNVCTLLTNLINGKWPKEPPSLLAHLGSYHSEILLHCLASDLENSLDDHRVKVCLYDFVSAVMGGNQEGLSILFISGEAVLGGNKKKSESKDAASHKQISLLSILKNSVKTMNNYPNSVALHLVDSISLAFNLWTTSRDNDKNDKVFIEELIRRIQYDIEVDGPPRSVDEFIVACYEYKLISKIAEILALYLFTSQNEECNQLIYNLLSSTSFIDKIESYFRIVGYKPLLHDQLHHNFEIRWPKMKLIQFTRSSLISRNRYGVGAVYSLILMDKLFGSDDYWPGYRDEIIMASVNLQYVSAQMATAKSLGALITAYGKRYKKPIDKKYLTIVAQLLKINCEEGTPAPIFNEVYQERIELAFFLIYTISGIYPEKKNSSDSNIYSIIQASSELLNSSDLNFIANLNDNSIEFYRPLLRIILISLNMLKGNEQIMVKLFSEYSSIFGDIFTLVVAKGAKNVFNSIQNEVFVSDKNDFTNSSEIGEKVEDIFLILAILRAFVSMNIPSNFKTLISNVLVENGTLRSILNLYSCSNSIKINNEPIFADITLMFIHELISIDTIAEKLISNGLLFSTLVESPISVLIQKGNIRATTTPRLHHIWSNGLLSIVLTLLSKFGAKLLPESLMFLSYFSKQISTAIYGWSEDSVIITVPYLHETGQLVLLYQVLNALQVEEYNDSYGYGHVGGAGEISHVFPGLDKEEERTSLIESFNHLLSHPKFLASRVAPSTVEEQRLFEGDESDLKTFMNKLRGEINEIKQSLSG